MAPTPLTLPLNGLLRYADVENILVPLNHIAELEVIKFHSGLNSWISPGWHPSSQTLNKLTCDECRNVANCKLELSFTLHCRWYSVVGQVILAGHISGHGFSAPISE